MRQDEKENKLDSKGIAAIVLAAVVVVAAVVLICGIAKGGWFASGNAQSSASNSSESAQSQITTVNTNAAGTSSEASASHVNDVSASNDAQSASAQATDGVNATGASASSGEQVAASEGGEANYGAGSDEGSASSSGSSDGDSGSSGSNAGAYVSVLLSVSSAAAHDYNSSWPADMGSYELRLTAGSTVYDALCATGVAIGGDSTYVKSINGLAEFACGSRSGWMYQVNNVTPNVSCGKYTLSDNDVVVWYYTCDYTKN